MLATLRIWSGVTENQSCYQLKALSFDTEWSMLVIFCLLLLTLRFYSTGTSNVPREPQLCLWGLSGKSRTARTSKGLRTHPHQDRTHRTSHGRNEPHLMYFVKNLRWKSFRTVSLMNRRASFFGSRDWFLKTTSSSHLFQKQRQNHGAKRLPLGGRKPLGGNSPPIPKLELLPLVPRLTVPRLTTSQLSHLG